MLSYNLFDLGQNGVAGNGERILSIPNIQRGLVWKPRQIELLWDSILRGFPIGTFTVMLKDAATSSGELIDGQQRLDAIQEAFKEPTKESQSIVWIDLGFNKDWAPERKFGIRVTTKSHPWGYRLDGSTLSAEERRKAIEEAHEEPGTPKTSWNILNFGPFIQSSLPVPFCYLIKASVEERADGDRVESLKSRCRQLAKIAPEWGRRYLNAIESLTDSTIEEIWKAIDTLTKYEISAIEIDGSDDLEILFERIGIGGTNITQKELAYATMKYYWDSEVLSKVNRDICQPATGPDQSESINVMPEPDFAMIIFRLFLSGNDNIKDGFTVQEIRAISRDEKKKEIINRAYDQDGAAIKYAVKTVDRWLLDSEFPPVIRSEIAMYYSKLYVFLLWLANRKKEENFSLSDEYMRALAYYLYVCVKEYSPRSKEKYKAWVIEYLYRNLQSVKQDVEKRITSLLNEMISLGWCIAPDPSLSDFKALNSEVFSNQWNYTQFNNNPYYDYFSRLFSINPYSLFVLKLFQKDYYNKYYSDYDPSRRELWADTNRPWDHDHIVPQRWGDDAGDWSYVVKTLISSIGNLADIPFELNRSKGDRPDWDHYNFNVQLLIGSENEEVYKEFKKIRSENFKDSLSDENGAKDLFSFVRSRYLKISGCFSKLIEPLQISQELPDPIKQRKKFLLSLKDKLSIDFTLYYVIDEIETPFNEEDNYGWQQEWISLGGREGTQYMPAVTIGFCEKDCRPTLYLEYGLRKKHDKTCKEIVPTPGWWKPRFYFHDLMNTPNLEESIIKFLSEDHQLD